MFCVIGPDGAGKTTLLEGFLGLGRLDRCTVRLFGVEVRGRPPFDVLRRVGYLLEGMGLDPALTAWENLRLAAAIGGVKTSDGELRAVLEAVGLWNMLRGCTVSSLLGRRRGSYWQRRFSAGLSF
jgi:ABC-2 type transport system ATP-binding protein